MDKFETWARSTYRENRDIIENWERSPDPFVQAKALLIKRYAGVGRDG